VSNRVCIGDTCASFSSSCATLSPGQLRQHARNFNAGLQQDEQVAEANLEGLTDDERRAVRLLAGRLRSSPAVRPKPARQASAAELRVEASRLESENARLQARAEERDRKARAEALHRWLHPE
jgi:hypothetical protein